MTIVEATRRIRAPAAQLFALSQANSVDLARGGGADPGASRLA